MTSRPDPRLDISIATFLIAVCLAVLWESRRIPPGVFEPLGSAPVPQATAIILIALCLVVLVRAAVRLSPGHRDVRPEEIEQEFPPPPENPRAVLITGIMTVAYVIILMSELASFALITTIFLFALISTLARFERRALIAAAIIAVSMGYGCQYVFTEIFVVDLPAG